MPEACAITKLGKNFWLNVSRRGLKNLDAVLNRVGKLEISVLLKQSKGLSAPAAPPHPNIRRVPPRGLLIIGAFRSSLYVVQWLLMKTSNDLSRHQKAREEEGGN